MSIDLVVVLLLGGSIVAFGWISFSVALPTLRMLRTGQMVRIGQGLSLAFCLVVELILLLLVLLVLLGVPTPWGSF